MDMTQDDFWITIKQGWTAQPPCQAPGDVLSASPACGRSGAGSPKLRKLAPSWHHGAPTCIEEAGADVSPQRSPFRTAGQHDNPGICVAAAMGNRTDAKELGQHVGGEQVTHVSSSARKSGAPSGAGRSDVSSAMDKAPEPRPRARDNTYAHTILRALCAAGEAKAAGQNELSVACTKLAQNLLEDWLADAKAKGPVSAKSKRG